MEETEHPVSLALQVEGCLRLKRYGQWQHRCIVCSQELQWSGSAVEKRQVVCAGVSGQSLFMVTLGSYGLVKMKAEFSHVTSDDLCSKL